MYFEGVKVRLIKECCKLVVVVCVARALLWGFNSVFDLQDNKIDDGFFCCSYILLMAAFLHESINQSQQVVGRLFG